MTLSLASSLNNRLLGASALALVLSVSSQALAQTTPQTDSEDDATTQLSLGKIVVSAGVEKIATDTPQAVTVLNQDDIDDTQASTIGDLLDDVPGVYTAGGASNLGQTFNIRGMTSNRGEVLMLVDGVENYFEGYRMGAFFSEPELYKRVEVLRGPSSSTLYGSGALAGVINFTTKDASDFLTGDDRFALRTRFGYESNGDGKLGSIIMATRPTENVDLLIALNGRSSDDYKDGNGDVVTPSDASANSVLAKARYYIGGDRKHSVWASAQVWETDSYQLYDQITGFTAFGTVRRRTRDEAFILGYDNGFEGNDLLDLKAQVSFSETLTDQDGIALSSSLGYASEYSYSTVQARIENTSKFTLSPDWTAFVTAGLQYYSQERRNPRYRADGSLQGNGATTHPEGDTTRYGGFVQAEILWRDKLVITPGLRIDHTELSPGAGVVVGGGSTAVPEEATNTGYSPKLAVLYNLTDYLNVFGSVAHTERMPILDEVYSRSGTAPVNLNLDPEKSDNYELGASLTLRGLATSSDRLNAKLTAFNNTVENLITSASATSGYFINVGEAKYEGFEVEAEYATRSLFARASYATVDATNETTGVLLNTRPADELNLNLGYVLNSLDLTVGWRGEFVSGITNYNATTGAVSSTVDSYNVHDLYATWRPRSGSLAGMDVRFSVDNVLDDYVKNNLASFAGQGRSFKLSLGKTF